MNSSFNFLISDPEIINFTSSPDSFKGLETSYSDSLPYSKLILICTAGKLQQVIPELEVIWQHNGTEISNNIQTSVLNDVTYKTNTLNFTNFVPEDSGNYTCIARIVIPESPTIQSSKESLITIIGKHKNNFLIQMYTFCVHVRVNITQ